MCHVGENFPTFSTFNSFKLTSGRIKNTFCVCCQSVTSYLGTHMYI